MNQENSFCILRIYPHHNVDSTLRQKLPAGWMLWTINPCSSYIRHPQHHGESMCPESIHTISQLMMPNWILMNRWKELRVFLLTWWKPFMRSSHNSWFTATLSTITSIKITSHTCSLCKMLQQNSQEVEESFIGLVVSFWTLLPLTMF